MDQSVKIAVLQRGWVFVGKYSKGKDGTVVLNDACCIRIWGTTKGLGQLVNGPLKGTVLDYAGTVSFHELTACFYIDCESEKWLKSLKD